MATYKDYTISTSFSNGVAPKSLVSEIAASQITVAGDGVLIEDDNCRCLFKNNLDATNKGYLDAIIAAHDGTQLEYPNRTKILNDILTNVSSQEQLNRLMDALDSSATLIAALDNFNYLLARSRVDKLVADEKITEDDRTLIFMYIPNY